MRPGGESCARFRSGVASAAVPRRRRPGRAGGRARGCSGSRRTCGSWSAPEMPEDQFQLLVRDGHALLRPLLVRRVPAAVSHAASRTATGVPPARRGRAARRTWRRKRGAVLALSHSGNWDAAGAWVAAMGMPITTVAERLQPEELYERFLAFRQGLGMEILPLTGGDAAGDGRAGRPGQGGLRRAAAGRPRLLPARRRGRVLRPQDPDAGRPGAAGAADRRTAAHRRHVLRAGRPGRAAVGPVGDAAARTPAT